MDYIDNKSLKGDEDEGDEMISIDGDGGISETSIPNNSIFDPNNLLDIDLNTRLKNPPINPFGTIILTALVSIEIEDCPYLNKEDW
ncbi:unnamed protein product [[Candida] boidinii]|nr:unnamed protein product [[Candida] boidinii]